MNPLHLHSSRDRELELDARELTSQVTEAPKRSTPVSIATTLLLISSGCFLMDHSSMPAEHGLHDMDMDMDMSMSMTFSKLGSYKVKILWDWWNVQQPFEYFLSCLFVVALAIGYHAMRRLQSRALTDLIVAKELNEELISSLTSPLMSGTKGPGGGHTARSLTARSKLKRARYAVISAGCYTLALLLMLIAMTYNSGLFIMLVVGYGVGDYLFVDIGQQGGLQAEHCH
eukprot:16785-Heterococcus_DN1.PRE.4